MRGIANFFCNNVPHLAYKEFLGILKVENKSAGFLNQGKSWYTHYELEGQCCAIPPILVRNDTNTFKSEISKPIPIPILLI